MARQKVCMKLGVDKAMGSDRTSVAVYRKSKFVAEFGVPLSPQQQAVVDWALNDSGSLNLLAYAGTGKCLGVGTMVMLYDGSTIPVENIKPGMLLMGPDSKPRKVASTSTGFGSLYKIFPIKGDSWVCNEAHVMSLKASFGPNKGEVVDIALDKFLCGEAKKSKRIRESKSKLKDNYRHYPSKVWKLFRVPINFPRKEVPIDPYLAGTWLGDGTTDGPTWTLGPTKSEIIQYVRNHAADYDCECFERPDNKSDDGLLRLRYRVGERGTNGKNKQHIFRRNLITHFGMGRQKTISNLYLKNSREIRLQLLAGLLDTDGEYQPRGGYAIVFKSKVLAQKVIYLCRSLGFAAYLKEKLVKLKQWTVARQYWGICVSGELSEIPCKVVRKQASRRKQIKNVLVTGWKAIKQKPGKFYGFTLSGDGRFLLGDFTVTHNTTTLIELTRVLQGEVFLGAFNKSIADELSRRLQAISDGTNRIQASTLHSAGFRVWRKVAPKVKVDSGKVSAIIGEILSPTEIKLYGAFVRKAVSIAKQSAFGVLCPLYDRQSWYQIIDHFDLEDELENSANPEPAIDFALEIFQKSFEMDHDVIDFDDMILCPLSHNVAMPQKDWVLLDELQDTNAARRALAIKMLKPETGRFVGVGDRHQAIYGFSGADSDAMDLVKAALGCSELPLSVTYRCPKKVVELAQQFVPDFTAHESAPEGIVRSVTLLEDKVRPSFLQESLKKEDAILCRNTKPLIEMAYSLLRRGIACRVEGREIGQGLIKLASRWKITTTDQLHEKLSEYRDREVQKWIVKGKEEKAAAVQDQVDTLEVIMERLNSEGKHTIGELVLFINSMFGDTPEGEKPRVLTLSTVHKAKGREWDRVYLLGRNKYMPSKYAKKEWALRQENNLQYVAITRAKKELVEIEVPI